MLNKTKTQKHAKSNFENRFKKLFYFSIYLLKYKIRLYNSSRNRFMLWVLTVVAFFLNQQQTGNGKLGYRLELNTNT